MRIGCSSNKDYRMSQPGKNGTLMAGDQYEKSY